MPAGRAKRARAPAAGAAGAGAGAADAAPPGGMTALHRWRSPPWAVSTATALAACPDRTAVAAAYEDGRIEVWHLAYLCRIMAIPGWEGAELSSLAWARDALGRRWRLFAGSLDGSIYEVDFESQRVAHASDSYGGAVWALAAAPAAGAQAGGGGGGGVGDKAGGAGGEEGGHDLVAACDDGSLRLLRVNGGVSGCEYVRPLAKAEGRALAVAWHPGGGAVVSGGSDGCIHAWDVKTGRELMRITASVRSGAPPRVWALAVLPDGTIVSGDSDGATQFWEGRFGTLISRLQQHAADVMAVAASADGSLVYSAGVDPRVAVFSRVEGGRWAYLAHKSPHTHEVRALAAAPRAGGAEELLLSGGGDGQLVLYPAARILQEHPVRLTKAPQAPLLQLAPRAFGGAPRLAAAQGRRVTLWRLGRAAPGRAPLAAASLAAAAQDHPSHPDCGGQIADRDLEQEGDPLDLSEAPACLAEIKLRGGRHVRAAAVSPDGGRVAVSDAAGVRLFEIEEGAAGGGAGGVTVRRVAPKGARRQQRGGGGDGSGDEEEGEEEDAEARAAAAPPPPAVCMAFSADSASLFCADASGCVRRVDAGSARVAAALELDLAGAAAPFGGAAAARGGGGGGGDDASDSSGSSGSGSSSSDSSSSDSDSDSDGESRAAAARRRRARRARGARTAAAAAAPAVSILAASPDGRWLAAAVGAGVQLVEVSPEGDLSPAGPLLLLGDAASPGAAPVTALAFSSDSSELAVATAGDLVASYSVATRAPGAWSAAHWEPLSRLLALLPGTVEGLSFEPADSNGDSNGGLNGGGGLLIRSAGGICHVDTRAPLSADVLSGKRRRGPGKPSPAGRASAAGLNGRVLPLDSPCLFLGFTGRRAALLVERPWEEVTAALPAPLLRHKYGT